MTSDLQQYIAIGIVSCLVLEQVVCLLYVPYLGRFGVTIHSSRKKISIDAILSRLLDKNMPKKLSLYKKEDAIFLKNRYSYRTFWLGPCVCAVRITERDASEVRIDAKMCPVLFAVFAFSVLRAIIAVVIGFETIVASLGVFINLFLFFCLMYIYYKVLLARVEKLCLR